MRRSLSIIFVFILFNSCYVGNETFTYKPYETLSYEPLLFEDTISSELNQNDLYIIANRWIIEQFEKLNNPIEFADKEEGIIKGKVVLDVVSLSRLFTWEQETDTIRAIITMLVRENETKIVLDPFGEVKHMVDQWGKPLNSVYSYEDAEEDADSLIQSYMLFVRTFKTDL